MSYVRLDDPETLPLDLLLKAERLAPLFRREGFMDELIHRPAFRRVADEVECFIRGNRVAAYHCTKELHRGFFESRGLRPLSLRRHVNEFLEYIEPRVPGPVFARFKATYDEWEQHEQIQYREGMIWFCMSRRLVKQESGTWRFFTYYGGEALYWPFKRGDECLAILEDIGNPVIVEVALPAADLIKFKELPFARDILSHLAVRANPEFYVDSLEGYVKRPIAADEIVEVHPRDNFFNAP